MTLSIFLSFQTTKGITTVDLREFAESVHNLSTQFQTLGKNLSGNDQANAFVSIGVPLLLILPFIASGQKKAKVRLPRGSKFWCWARKNRYLVAHWASKINRRGPVSRLCLKPGIQNPEKKNMWGRLVASLNAEWLWSLVIRVRKLSESSFRSVCSV